MNKYRQGQTLYYVSRGFDLHRAPKLMQVFLHSQKTPLPPPGAIIERVPVTVVIKAAQAGQKFYASRRKAMRALRLEQSK